VWTITGIYIVIEIAFTERYTTQVVVFFFSLQDFVENFQWAIILDVP